jgi:rhodanese-related sulfurtransferase
VYDFFRSYRILAEERLPEIERIRRRFLDDPNELYPVDADTLIKRVKMKEVVLLDVRPEEEYRSGHVKGALGIPMQDLRRRLARLPRKKDIVAYCRGPYCMFAVDAVQMLRAHGLRAFRLGLSVHDWSALGLPVATGAEAPTASTGTRSS